MSAATTSFRIAPSILSAVFGRLAEEVQAAERAGADWIHVDVMDGRFVPNLTMGAGVVRSLRGGTKLPIDVHLMVEAPERLLDEFIAAGADCITVHQETCRHLHRILSTIRERGVRAGVALNPATPVESVSEVLDSIDLLLVMTVNPGFSGQRFIPASVEKIRRARQLLESVGAEGRVELQVDGGIDLTTASAVVEAGATVLVAGSALFGAPGGIASALPELRAAATHTGTRPTNREEGS
jgi:ribulose-phosphate 3-epimerase